ncbi:M48 family metalloprotease [candidate division KSB3 bacterium]|uniref:M48 family metalloprotease n=1 Tax=candidate division KSB3 bacterium TaxID=2044937 RepID=A0A9D5JYW7_9BACT|nr:M48 family metalloprotease [candidate division KSB3 bacterium]MBD3326347.1 M48 family metalloprotease [candidate division KSB3 bacterium]
MDDHPLGERVSTRTMTRRDFLWLASVSTAGIVTGCAVNPVTGQRQLMLVTEDQEIQIDQENSPHQFSSDYGPLQDPQLNTYIAQVGQELVVNSHRPNMPYSFRGVNATYVNAYAFPGGSIAATRGILLEMENEAELAALLGHEIGHVNARHTAERMTKNLVVGALVAGATAYLEAEHEKWAPLAAGLGGIAAGALLAHYSREDERQADALGMEYMTRIGQNPSGMVGLMDVLRSLSKHKPSTIEMMFSTHPMSEERFQTAQQRAATDYPTFQNAPVNRDRYMDYTAGLRRIKGAIEDFQEGEKAMAAQKYRQAESSLDSGLQQAPDDYAGLVMMAKCHLAQNNHRQAEYYAQRAKEVFPTEAQAHHISGMAQLGQNNFGAAYQEFDNYERMLPGNPNTIFLKGVTLEGMQHRQQAAEEYYRYLQAVNQGDQAQYAYQRLVKWGYLQPQE